jgi:formylglycine-generating enzyme required for sulfatase activity
MTGSAGVLIDYGSHARLRTGLTYNQLVSAEVMLQFFPLGDNGASSLNPYIQAGWGRYFADGDQEGGGVLPIGLGLEYALSDRVGLTVDVERRWGSVKLSDSENPNDEFRGTLAGWLPTLGVTYKLSDFAFGSSDETSDPELPPPSASTTPENETATAPSSTNQDDPLPPFPDPVAPDPEGQPPNYTRDSLKQSPPLTIDRWDPAPYESPGAPVGAGAVDVVEDGDMVRLPSGVFIMGLTAPDPLDLQTAGRKRISLSPFYIDRFEVTNEEYRTYLNAMVESGEFTEQDYREHLPDSTAFRDTRARWRSYFYNDSNADHPVVAVTWSEAQAYCEWENKRLPTEAEWEYAARAGRTGGLYPWAGVFARHDGQYLANFNPERQGMAADGYAFTAPVGSFPPNRWGLHDVAGNAAEWTFDTYTPSYSQLSSLNPAYRDSSETRHVVRGGSYAARSFNIGVGKRSYQSKDEASTQTGFRCAADVSQIEDDGPAPGPGFNRPSQPPPETTPPDENDNTSGL